MWLPVSFRVHVKYLYIAVSTHSLTKPLHYNAIQSKFTTNKITYRNWWLIFTAPHALQIDLHRVRKKCHIIFCHNFAKSWPIFKILLPSHSAVNLQ